MEKAFTMHLLTKGDMLHVQDAESLVILAGSLAALLGQKLFTFLVPSLTCKCSLQHRQLSRAVLEAQSWAMIGRKIQLSGLATATPCMFSCPSQIPAYHLATQQSCPCTQPPP
jgi:hypothetical protein